jgi:hypothetical protein
LPQRTPRRIECASSSAQHLSACARLDAALDLDSGAIRFEHSDRAHAALQVGQKHY